MSRTPRGTTSGPSSSRVPNARVLIDYTARNTKQKTKYDVPKDGLVRVVRTLGGWMEVTLEHCTMEYAVYSDLIANEKFGAQTSENRKHGSSSHSTHTLKKLFSRGSDSSKNINENIVLRIPSIYVQRLEGVSSSDEVQKLQQKWKLKAQQVVARYERIQERIKQKNGPLFNFGAPEEEEEEEDDDDDSNDDNDNGSNDDDDDDAESDARSYESDTKEKKQQEKDHGEEGKETSQMTSTVQQLQPQDGGEEDNKLDEPEQKEETRKKESKIKDNDQEESRAMDFSKTETETVQEGVISKKVDPNEGSENDLHGLIYAEEMGKKRDRSVKNKLKKTINKMKSQARTGTIFSRFAAPNLASSSQSEHWEEDQPFSLTPQDEVLKELTREESEPQPALTEEEATVKIREALLDITRRKRFMDYIYGSRELRNERLRLATVKELISTERSYVSSLSICVDTFFQPLAGSTLHAAVSPDDLIMEIEGQSTEETSGEPAKKSLNRTPAPQKNVLSRMRSVTQTSISSSYSKYSTLLSAKEVTTIFGNLPQILSVNMAFLKLLEKEWNKFPVFNAGTVMSKFVTLFKCYTVFVNGYDRSAAELERLQRSNTKLVHFLEKRYEASGAHTLSTFLIMPVQRIPRYRMLFKELLKRTPQDHTDYDNIQTALVKISELAEFVNEQKRLDENNHFVRSLQKYLSLRYVHLLQPHRNFIKRGKMLVSCTRRNLSDVCNVYLFTDMLLVVPCAGTSKISLDDSDDATQEPGETSEATKSQHRIDSIMGLDNFNSSNRGDKGRVELIFFAFSRLLEENLTRRHSRSSLKRQNRTTFSQETNTTKEENTSIAVALGDKNTETEHAKELSADSEQFKNETTELTNQNDSEAGAEEKQSKENDSDSINTESDNKSDSNNNDRSNSNENGISSAKAVKVDSNKDDEITSFKLEAFLKTTYFIFQFEALSSMEAREWHSNIMQQMQQIHLKIQSKNIYLQSTMDLYEKKRQSTRASNRVAMIKRMSRRALLLDSTNLDSETVSAMSIDRERGRLYMKLQTHINKLNRLRTEWDLARNKSYAAERVARDSRVKISNLQKLMTEQEEKLKELSTIMSDIDKKKITVGKDKDRYLSTLQELDAQILSALNGDIGAFREVFNKDPAINNAIIFSEESNDELQSSGGGSSGLPNHTPRGHRSRANSSSMDLQTEKLESIAINNDRFVQDELSRGPVYFKLPQNADALVLLPSLPGTGIDKQQNQDTHTTTATSTNMLRRGPSLTNMRHHDPVKARTKQLMSRYNQAPGGQRYSLSDVGPIHLSRETLKKLEQFNPSGIDTSTLKQPRWAKNPDLKTNTSSWTDGDGSEEIFSAASVETDEDLTNSDGEYDMEGFGEHDADLKPLPTKGSWYNSTDSAIDDPQHLHRRIMVRSREELDANNPYVIYFGKYFEVHQEEQLARLAEELREEAFHSDDEEDNDENDYVETFNVFYRSRPYEKHFVIEQESLPYRYRFQRQRYCDSQYEIIDSPPLQIKWDPKYDRSDLYTSFNSNLHLMHSPLRQPQQPQQQSQQTDTDDPDIVSLLRRYKMSELPDNPETLKMLVLQLSEEALHWRNLHIKADTK